MACSNYWTSPMHVGDHEIARAFLERGWDVAYISNPISPLHWLGADTDDVKRRYAIYKNDGMREETLWAYVPWAFLSPANKPLLKDKWIYQNWEKFTYPNVVDRVHQEGFLDVDIFYSDTAIQAFWMKYIRCKKSVARVADRLDGFDGTSESMINGYTEVIQKVDYTVYSAKSLHEYVNSMHPRHSVYFPNGVNFNHFLYGNRTMPVEYKNIKHPIILYVGAIQEWFDYSLLRYAAGALRDCSFVIIGHPEQIQKKAGDLPNVYILGKKAYSQIPAYLYNADVGIIPFDVKNHSKIVNNINPLKLYEYMACGLPVVAASWEELEQLESPALLYHEPDQFVAMIRYAIENYTLQKKELFVSYAKKQSWHNRVNCLLEEIGEA